MARDVERLAHILVHALRAVRGDVMRAGGGGERRLVDRLVVPLGVDRRFAGEHHQRDARRARPTASAVMIWVKPGPAGHRGDADLAGRAVVAHRHRAGAVLMPGEIGVHAVEFFIAVAQCMLPSPISVN